MDDRAAVGSWDRWLQDDPDPAGVAGPNHTRLWLAREARRRRVDLDELERQLRSGTYRLSNQMPNPPTLDAVLVLLADVVAQACSYTVPTVHTRREERVAHTHLSAYQDAFDLFGLDDNAPLELIDDSTLPPTSPRKTASR